MIARGVAMLGLLVLASAGCATFAAVGNGGDGGAITSSMTSEAQQCEGWYDANVSACDSMGSN